MAAVFRLCGIGRWQYAGLKRERGAMVKGTGCTANPAESRLCLLFTV